ncbi:MAG: molybdopterin converting factor subunit 1 [Burkholderiaceae bacterium]
MKLHMLYFASVREGIGLATEMLEAPAHVRNVAQLRSWLAQRGPAWTDSFAEGRRVRAAVDQSMVSEEHPLHEGAEVAFFPPVTGG